ncbi:MAG: peroxiredoxin family protein [Marmoricola sp.]
MTLLHPGDPFPDLEVDLIGVKSVHLHVALHGGFGIVLFHRGAWCPFCNGQLRGFERVQEQLTELGAKVVSLSVDDEETTAALVEKRHLTFQMGHSADAHGLAEATGAFVNPEPVHLQATGFVLDPEGKVALNAYSSGAIGRLTPEAPVGLIRYSRKGRAEPVASANTRTKGWVLQCRPSAAQPIELSTPPTGWRLCHRTRALDGME